MNNRLEVSVDEHVDRASAAEFRVASMQPDLYAVRPVNVLQLTNDVVDIYEAVPGLGDWARGSSSPVLNLPFPHACDLSDLGRSQAASADFID